MESFVFFNLWYSFGVEFKMEMCGYIFGRYFYMMVVNCRVFVWRFLEGMVIMIIIRKMVGWRNDVYKEKGEVDFMMIVLR